MQNLIGRRVEYTGDMANAARAGVIENVTTDRFGQLAWIRWDNPETIGWYEDGSAVERTEDVRDIPVGMLREAAQARPGDRFRLV